MAIVFVRQNATGADDGSSEANAKSMTWFNANCAGGNTYILIGEITSIINPANSGADGSPIIIQAHPTLGAYRAPTGSNSGINLNGRAYIDVSGFVLDMRGASGNAVFLQNGANNINISAMEIYGGTGTSAAVGFAGASASAYSNITATDLRVFGGYAGIRGLFTVNALAHTGFTFLRNTILDVVGEGIRLTAESGLTTTTISQIAISENYIRRTGMQSISIRAVFADVGDNTPPALWGSGCKIWQNDIADCGSVASTGAVHVLGSQDVEIWNNKVHRCYTQGALIQGQRRRRVRIFDNNVSGAISASGIDGNGIFADRFDTDVKVFRNDIADCPGVPGVPNSGAGLAMWMCDDVKFFANVVRRCKHGLDVGGNAVKALTNCAAFDNAFVDIVENGFQSDSDGTGMGADALALRNNLFLRCATAINARGRTITTCDYNGFADVTTRYAGGQSAGANDVTADGTVTTDGRPHPGSPLLTGGVDLGLRRDINGVLGRKFIGAFGAAAFRSAP